MGGFFKSCPGRAKAGFKKSPSGEKWVSDDCSYLCKRLNIYSSFIKFKNKRKK